MYDKIISTVFIILNYKTYNDSILLTHELLEQGLGDRVILIVDNASPNESLKVLTKEFQNESQVEVISSGENGGYAKGNNYGLRYAKKYNPQYVCIINNDVHFDLSVIEKLENKIRDIDDVAFLSPIQCLPNGKPAPLGDLDYIPNFWWDFKTTAGLYWGRRNKHIYKSNCNDINLQKVQFIPGAFMFIRYSLFEMMGFFYEGTFLFCEERYVACKVKELGLQSYILLDTNYIHAHSVTINSESSRQKQLEMLFTERRRFTRNCRKNPKIKVLLLNFSYYILRPIVNIIRHGLKLLLGKSKSC